MRTTFRLACILLGISSILAGCAKPIASSLQCPAIFSDHMVLQQGVPCRVWGWAPNGETVTVVINGQGVSAVATGGQWQVQLAPMSAGGPHVLTVSCGSERLSFDDVLVGEVWVCSGQSNMEWPVASSKDPNEEIAAADYPDIRLFTVEKGTSAAPRDNVAGQWERCSPETVKDFSAVGYFFGRDLLTSGVGPIGLIDSTWGGTPVEAWTSRPVLQALTEAAPILARDEGKDPAQVNLKKKYGRYMKKNPGTADDIFSDDTTLKKGWAKMETKAKGWETAELPKTWEDAGLPVDGVVWYRREVTVPADWAGRDLTLNLVPIDDFDQTFFNGISVGATYTETPNSWQTPRAYAVPGKLVKAGTNVITVRVFDTGGGGGFVNSDAAMQLKPGDGAQALDLRGTWSYRIELVTSMGATGAQNRPAHLYNAMIAPIVDYAIKGAIWYQGESNAGRAYQYRSLFPGMIKDWRRSWSVGDFPFYFVQLANFMACKPEPGDSNWAELREAQNMTLSLPNTGQAVIIDAGDANDIHPRDKQTVGHRLARIARARDYGQKIVYSGPVYQSFGVEGNKIRLRFSHTHGGLVSRDGELRGFAIAGEDREFVWAAAKIDGTTVVVHSPTVEKPVAVRYAWADNPACTLYNGAGLPASPFRTDQWPGMTVDKE